MEEQVIQEDYSLEEELNNYDKCKCGGNMVKYPITDSPLEFQHTMICTECGCTEE